MYMSSEPNGKKYKERKLLKKLIKDKNLKREKIAEEVGFTIGQFNHFLNGRRGTTIDKAVKIAEILNVPMGEIFDSNNEIDHSNLAVKEQPTTYQVNTDKNQVLALLYTQQDILDQDNYMPLVIDIPKLDGLDYGANIFAYKLHDDSQQPRYNKNDLLIFDRHATQKPSDIVIATYDGNVIIGKYRLIGRDDFEISPLNTDYGSIKNTDADLEIEGVLIQAVIIV